MRHRLTASRVDLARACVYWARGDIALPGDDTSPAARLGSAVHEAADADGDDELPEGALDAALSGGILAAIGDRWQLTPAQRRRLADLHASWLTWWQSWRGALPWSHEVGLAYDVEWGTARLLPGPRDYDSLGPSEVGGTADALADGEAVWVCDWKTGRGDIAPAAQNGQLATLALAACRLWGRDRAHVALVHLDGDEPRVDVAVLGPAELEAHAARLAALVEAIPGAEPRPGPWCAELYCPARATCPETRAALATVVETLPAERRTFPLGEVRSDEEALAILEAAPLLEAAIAERVRAAKAHGAAAGVLRRADGTVALRLVPETRETVLIDTPARREALVRALGPERARLAEKATTSKEAIRRALASPRGKGAAELEAALDVLRAAGGVSVGSYDVWRKPRGKEAQRG